jgi:hypothetical protein
VSLPALLVAAFIAGSFFSGIGVWKVQSWRHDAQLLAQQARADEREAQWQQDANTADEVHDEEIKRVHSEHLRDLERLRNRPAKRLPTTPESCSGASPTALSAPDSELVRGWGAEFDILRAEYAKCKAAVNQ